LEELRLSVLKNPEKQFFRIFPIFLVFLPTA